MQDFVVNWPGQEAVMHCSFADNQSVMAKTEGKLQ
jgi:hypothetical protein